MAEFDPELIDEVLGEDRLLDTVSRVSADASGEAAKVADQFFNNSEFKASLEQKYPADDFTKNEKGDVMNDDKNLTEMRTDLNEGNVEKVMKDMGFDTSSPEVKDYVESETTKVKESEVKQASAATDEAIKKGETANKPEPTSNEELKETIPDADSIFKKFQDAAKQGLKELKEAIESTKGSTVLTILKVLGGLALAAAIILAAKDLYDMIKRLQHAMSGCFSCIGGKCCKIAALTCDDNDIQNTDGSVPFCMACTDFDCKTGGDWLPIKKADACACSGDVSGKNAFQGYDYNKPSGYNNCGGTNTTCPLKNTIVPSSYTPTDSACPGYSGCISRKEACGTSGDDCSKWCSSDYITLRDGQTVECKQMNFWGAAASLLGNAVDNLFPSGLLGKIEKILIYIALGLVGIAVLYMLGRYIFGKMTGDGGGGKREKVEIEIQPIVAPAKFAFGKRRGKH